MQANFLSRYHSELLSSDALERCFESNSLLMKETYGL